MGDQSCEVGLLFIYLFLKLTYLFYFTTSYWFCHPLTWIRHGCTRAPHPEPPSHLPPHPIPLAFSLEYFQLSPEKGGRVSYEYLKDRGNMVTVSKLLMDWPVEEGTKVVYGSQRSEDTDLKPRWPGCGFLISTRNCLKIQNARGVAGLSQEVVSTCYARHVSREPRVLDEVSQGGLASRLMAGLGNWQGEIIRPLKTWFYDERYAWPPWERGDSEMITSLW